LFIFDGAKVNRRFTVYLWSAGKIFDYFYQRMKERKGEGESGMMEKWKDGRKGDRESGRKY